MGEAVLLENGGSGIYSAYGCEFVIEGYEMLPASRRVWKCRECHKAFKDKGSLDYHAHLKHQMAREIEEKQRLRDAAAEQRRRAQEAKLLQAATEGYNTAKRQKME